MLGVFRKSSAQESGKVNPEPTKPQSKNSNMSNGKPIEVVIMSQEDVKKLGVAAGHFKNALEARQGMDAAQQKITTAQDRKAAIQQERSEQKSKDQQKLAEMEARLNAMRAQRAKAAGAGNQVLVTQ